MRVFHLIFRSRLTTAAALSIIVLLAAAVFQVRHALLTLGAPAQYDASSTPQGIVASGDALEQQEMLLLGLASSSDPSAVTPEDVDPIAMIGPMVMGQLVGQYAGLIDGGTYSESAGTAAAESIARNVRAAITYDTYASVDLKTDADTSYDRMIRYRSDLREAFAPLLKNTESELEMYAKYVETSDPIHLERLSSAAQNYREAARNTARVTVPRDAINYHLSILNAMAQFAATLDAMAKNADDPFSSVALLRNYNSAEESMLVSFDSLKNYYGQKLP